MAFLHVLNRFRLSTAIIVFLLLFVVLYPFYRYIFDPDAIGYMMITKRLAAGDYYHSINGMWSPLHSWLVVPFFKMGIDEITAFKHSNAVISVLILLLVSSLLKKIPLPDGKKTAILLVCVPILLWYSFFQIAADILVCVPLLWYINIISKEDFFENKSAQAACGVAGAVAYLCKSYLFPYFILHYCLVQLYLYKNSIVPGKKTLLKQNLLVGLGVFVALCSGWIVTLSYKFQKFTIGFAGAYNHKLSLLEPVHKDILVPPVLPGSPHVWEDVSYVDFGSYGSVEPLFLILKQVRVILYQFMEMLKNYSEISVFSLAIILGLFIYLGRKKNQLLSVFFITLVTLPVGYLLMHIETRYLWATTFLLLIGGSYLLNTLINKYGIPRRVSLVSWICFFCSFLVYPVDGLKDSVGKHKEVFNLATVVKQLQLKGRFASNDSKDIMGRMAYLTENAYLPVYNNRFTQQELLQDMKQKGVDYYFFFYQHPGELEQFSNQLIYKKYELQKQAINKELIVFRINEK